MWQAPVKRFLRLSCVLLLAVLALSAPARAAEERFNEPLAGLELIRVAGGVYHRGDFSGRGLAQERPAHAVSISDFFLSRTEVTVSQFRTFVEVTGYRTEAERAGARSTSTRS